LEFGYWFLVIGIKCFCHGYMGNEGIRDFCPDTVPAAWQYYRNWNLVTVAERSRSISLDLRF